MNEPVSPDAQASGFGPSSGGLAAGPAGVLLREARESQGVHVAALAVALKVPVRQIEALEEDRLDLLPDLVFARALAASVCRQLKVDPQLVLARLPQGQPRLRKEREPINEPFRTPGQSSGGSWRDRLGRPPVLVALVLLLGAIVLLALPLFQGDVAVPEPATTATPAAPSTAPAPAPASPPGLVTESVMPALPATPGAPAGTAGEGIPAIVPALPPGPAASR